MRYFSSRSSFFAHARRAGHNAIQGALEAAAEESVRSAKGQAPVLTGRLRDSIHATPVERTASRYETTIQTDVPYALFIEFGTAHAPAHAFLRPGVRSGGERIAPEFKARFERS